MSHRELQRYHHNPFDLAVLDGEAIALPLADEPFLPIWEAWAMAATREGAAAVLSRHLPQLAFPIQAGISDTAEYRAATLEGQDPRNLATATGLAPPALEGLELHLHRSAAGRIPILLCHRRKTFETLVRALARKNEPVSIPAAMGALMVGNFTDGRRDHEHRLILLSSGPYSGVEASALGLEEEVWQHTSLALRREHECAHYLTRRLLGAMRNNILDEVIADYAGFQALPEEVGGPGFRADWFLHFLGLEDFPTYRQGARLSMYRGDPPLSDGAFRLLHRQIRVAARNLERLDQERTDGPPSPERTALTLLALASLRFDEIADPEGVAKVKRELSRIQRRVTWQGEG